MHTIEIDLDVMQDSVVMRTCKQYDDLILVFNIYDNSVSADLTNYICEFRSCKQDKTYYIENDQNNISISGNKVTINAQSQLTSCSGETKCELLFKNRITGKKKYSFDLTLKAKKSVLEDGVSSESTITLITRLNKVLDELADDITKGDNLHNELNDDITSATDIYNKLETDIPIGNDLADRLERDEASGSTLADRLEQDIADGNRLDGELQIDIGTGEDTKTDLVGLINDAEEKLKEFREYDTDSIAKNLNDMFNEIFPIKKLISITHNLGEYPNVQLIYVSNGYGISEYGYGGYGVATGETEFSSYKVSYTDKNNIDIYVANNYYKDGATVETINNFEYSITVPNLGKTILARLTPFKTDYTYITDENDNYIVDEYGNYLVE